MALTIEIDEGGASKVIPWPIDYRHYNDPKRNAFFASAPELQPKAAKAADAQIGGVKRRF